MSLKFFTTPFALHGDLQEIPDALQTDGKVSFATGYGVDYERNPASDPNAKDIERAGMNWLFGAITTVLRQYQTVGVYPYITPEQNGGSPYAYIKGARCFYTINDVGGVYESVVENNTAAPSDTAKWQRINIEDLARNVLASPALRGLVPPGGSAGQYYGVSADGKSYGFRNLDLSGLATSQALTAHANSTNVHGATAAATASRIMMRDAAGRAQVAAPAAAADIARKDTVDAVNTALTTHGNLVSAHGATAAATANRIILRDAAGRAQVANPSAATDIANKGFVEGLVAGKFRVWVSGEFAIAKATRIVATHNLKLDPTKAFGSILLRCKAAEGGYAVGDYGQFSNYHGGDIDGATMPQPAANNIAFTVAPGGIYVLNKNTGAQVSITPASWRFVFQIFY